MTVDKLEELFEAQKAMQDMLNIKYDQEYREKMILASIDELMEMLRETPWKPWKKHQKYNKKNYKKELIDLWHFVINLSLDAGFTPKSLLSNFKIKNSINKLRQKDGY